MANPKTLTCECFGSDVQISVKLQIMTFWFLSFPHMIELSSPVLFFHCQYIYYKNVPWSAALLLLIVYSVVNADVSQFQILKDSLRWWCTFVLWSHALPSSACGYQCYDHNISCKWLRALVCIQVRKPIIRHSLPSVKADNLFLEEDSFHLQPKFTLWRTYFPLTMKGALPYSIPGSWNARHSDIRMWNSEWQIQAYLFIKKPVYPSAGSHSSCFTVWSIC